MLKVLLLFSLMANGLFMAATYYYALQYSDLLVWACAHGNGGSECGEE